MIQLTLKDTDRGGGQDIGPEMVRQACGIRGGRVTGRFPGNIHKACGLPKRRLSKIVGDTADTKSPSPLELSFLATWEIRIH